MDAGAQVASASIRGRFADREPVRTQDARAKAFHTWSSALERRYPVVIASPATGSRTGSGFADA